jgi:hypothetical protein
VVTVASAEGEVRRQIEDDFVNTLERCPRMTEESSRDLLVANIGRRLGAGLSLRKQATTRTYVIELVQVCAGQPRGLELLAKELEFIDPLAREVPELLCLSDEWQAAAIYANDMWPELRAALSSIRLTPAGDDRGELGVLRRLVVTATESRIEELPHHCSTLWHVFVYLAGANALPGKLPPCMVLLECVAQEIADPALARKLRKWNRTRAEYWHFAELLDSAWWRVTEPLKEPQDVHLVIRIEPDPAGSDRLLISHWRQWDPDVRRLQHGANMMVSASSLEASIDRIVIEMEAMLGARADVARTGEFWLEFVLPADMLNLPVQLWPKTALLGEVVPLALDHPVVVRSLERIDTPHLRRAWKQRWKNLSTAQVKSYWSRPNGVDYFTRLDAELSYDKSIMSVVLSQPPTHGNDTALRELIAALRVGVPAIIWHQVDCSSIEFREVVTTMMAAGDLTELPQRLARLRQEALRLPAEPQGHPCRQVALLWDDPGRLPQPPRGIG